MAKMLALVMLLLVIGCCSALVVGPRIYEQDDFGDISLSEFTYSISTDCTAAAITVVVMNESLKPVMGANTYLKYVDFATPLMGSGVSDKDGRVLLKLPGNVNLMRGLFILVIEKKGYRGKEVHFDLSPCIYNTTNPAKPSKPTSNASAANSGKNNSNANGTNNQTIPGGNGAQGNNTNQSGNENASGGSGSGNASGAGDGSGGSNESAGGGTGSEGGGNPGLCAASLALPVLLFMVFKWTRRKKDGGAAA